MQLNDILYFINMITTRLFFRFGKQVPVVDVTGFLSKKGDNSK